MIINADVYLEHFGKKGMKWGVRNKHQPPGRALTPAERKQRVQRQQKVARVVRKVALGVIAVAYVSSLLKASGGTRTSEIKMPKAKVKTAADFVRERRDVEVASLKRMHAEGKMDATQHENFLRILNARYDRKIAAAV